MSIGAFPADDHPLLPRGEAAAEPSASPGSLSSYRGYLRATRLALPHLPNKQLNHSLPAIKILSCSPVNLCKENLTSIRFWLKLGLPEPGEAQLWLHQLL